MHEFQATLTSMLVFTFASIFSIVNPIGMAPVFLEQTRGHPPSQRHALAYKVAVYGALLLVVTLFVGPYILEFFGISLEDIQIAGGLFIFYMAWQMLTTPPGHHEDNMLDPEDTGTDIAFFPLTMPLTAGAGSIAIAISLSSTIADEDTGRVAGYVGAVIGICLVFVFVALCYRFGDVIFERIGKAGTRVITRLTAFLLLAIGVAVAWSGMKPLLLSLHA